MSLSVQPLASYGIHRETYMIDGERFTAIANFYEGTGRICGRNFNYFFDLDEYTEFMGNMEDFIRHHVKGEGNETGNVSSRS